jgi:alpha-L-rhamnosidase
VPNVFQHRGKPDPHAVWADVVALLPRDLYTSYADKEILEEQFATMTLWLERGVPRRSDGTALWAPDAIQFGDWLDPRAPPQYPANGQTDTHLVANAYLVYVTGVVATTAKLLKRHKEAQRFDNEYAKLKLEFQREYVTPNGRLASDSQTAYALALSFNLLPPESRPTAIQRLDWLIRYDTFKISTGFAGTPLILHALADADLLHLAYRMLQEKEDPSWLYAVRMGATTVVSGTRLVRPCECCAKGSALGTTVGKVEQYHA